MLDNNINTEIVKKKRGRKSKNDLLNGNSKDLENKIVKKRGRKVSTKIINLTEDTNIITNIIVHLPLKYNDIVKVLNNDDNSDINEIFIDNKKDEIINNKTKSLINIQTLHKINEYDNNDELVELPRSQSFNENHCNENHCNENHCNECNILKNKIKILEEENIILKNNVNNYNNIIKKIHDCSINIIYDNNENNKYNNNILCWWCCHKFDNIPLGIPDIINKNIFYIHGYFCSFNCMLAYNIDLNDYRIWDRQALIYQMKNTIDINNDITIFPAPPRQLLDIFGGPIDINKFRNKFYSLNSEFRYCLPPMISSISIIEESYYTNVNNKNNKTNKPYIFRTKPLPKQGFQV